MSTPSDPSRLHGEKSVTIDGVKVKSKAEKTIADYFVSRSIKYEYEKMVRTWALGSKIGFPDFYLPEYDVYVEYWGDPNDAHYNRCMKWKMAKYREHNYKFISIYPDNLANLDWIFPLKFKTELGIEFPQAKKNTQEAA
jgi:hypothetical protein